VEEPSTVGGWGLYLLTLGILRKTLFALEVIILEYENESGCI
jgi:hypothetical protein